jgi:hypothetical protein
MYWCILESEGAPVRVETVFMYNPTSLPTGIYELLVLCLMLTRLHPGTMAAHTLNKLPMKNTAPHCLTCCHIAGRSSDCSQVRR